MAEDVRRIGKQEDFVEPCCDDDLCKDCTAENTFAITFYFDKHRILVSGCNEAVNEIETILSDKLRSRVPKL